MFFPEAMTELELIIPEKDLLPVTKALAGRGVFHQVDASYLSSDDASKSVGTWKEQAAAYSALERQILFAMQALAVDEAPPTSAIGSSWGMGFCSCSSLFWLSINRSFVSFTSRSICSTNGRTVSNSTIVFSSIEVGGASSTANACMANNIWRSRAE